MNTDTTNMTDHDLLITLHEQVKNVRDDIKGIKDGTAITLNDHENRIRNLEVNLVDKKDFQWLQRIAYGGIGICVAAQLYFNYIK